MDVSFIGLEEFCSMILLKIWSMPLTWGSFPSSILIFWWFGHFMVSLVSCMFLSCALLKFSCFLVWSVFTTLSLGLIFSLLFHLFYLWGFPLSFLVGLLNFASLSSLQLEFLSVFLSLHFQVMCCFVMSFSFRFVSPRASVTCLFYLRSFSL